MTFRTLILRSLRFHWRAHLGVLLGAAVGSAALIGALVVGDSVRESLRERALQRLGDTDWVLASQDRLFRAELASGWEGSLKSGGRNLQGGEFAALLELPALASTPDGRARANQVRAIGVDRRICDLGGDPCLANLAADGVALNRALASQLGARPGDVMLLRVHKPSGLSGEVTLSPRSDADVTLRLRVQAVVPSEKLGDLNLIPSQQTRFNAFVSLARLQAAAGANNQANVILVGQGMADDMMTVPISRARGVLRLLFSGLAGRKHGLVDLPGGYGVSIRGSVNYGLNSSLGFYWQLADTGLQLRPLADSNVIELRSRRVFLDPPVVRVVEGPMDWSRFLVATNREELAEKTAFARGALGRLLDDPLKSEACHVLTYLANLLRAGTNATPYSMVTAAGGPWTTSDMRDDEILVNQWLADDLRVTPGDSVELSYFLPESGAKLTEATNQFRVRAVVPMEMPWADRTLMPEFPGLDKAESTRDWDTAFPLVHKLRSKDEAYWKQFRGTPKAFVTLAAGQKMWRNRFGDLTAIRFPVPTNVVAQASQPAGSAGISARSERAAGMPPELAAKEGRATQTAGEYRAAIERKILATLKPEDVGLRFEPVREQALKAAEQSQDFGQLFLGFSFFLIAAALLLMALLFQLGVEQRTMEVGTLLALGFRPKQVRRLLLGEGVALALIGSVVGALGGAGYAKAMLHGLATIWRDAVGTSALQFHATAGSIVIGIVASVAAAALAVWLTLRGLARRPARELLAGEVQSPKAKARTRAGWVAAVALALALGTIVWAVVRGETANAESFFSAGALLLIAGLAFVSARLAVWRQPVPAASQGGSAHPTVGSLALSGATRRRTRSLATVGLLACGSFLIVSIGVFRLDVNRDATRRSSGTGGFALIGESTMPVVRDLNSKAGRESFGFSESDLRQVSVVPFRVRDGDEASCLNLNRAQKPRLLGAKPKGLEGRFTFAKVAKGLDLSKGWSILRSSGREEAQIKSEVRRPTSEVNQSLVAPAAKNVDEVPAIGDLNSILWAMGKKVGDTLDYVDERGQPFKVRLVGAVANSILQGGLVIDEAEFVKRFPSESGYRFFLLDMPTNAVAEVSATLSRALQDYGLEITPAARRLAQFNAVQNTYLGTFQVLGGLGLLLGSAGLGVVVLRNVLERRGELAVLLAVGFRKRALHRLVLVEHGALLALGLGVGVVSAAVVVLPSLLSPGTQLPWFSLTVTLASVLANGALWTWLATRSALRGNLLEALRSE